MNCKLWPYRKYWLPLCREDYLDLAEGGRLQRMEEARLDELDCRGPVSQEEEKEIEEEQKEDAAAGPKVSGQYSSSNAHNIT